MTIRNAYVYLLVLAACSLLRCGLGGSEAEPLSIGTFNVDATPPIGSPVAYAPARSITDPLSARGVVILSKDKPVVLCAVDWIGIANGGHDAWREALAEAAGTSVDRVAVHTLHQHDGVRCDFTTEALLEEQGIAGRSFQRDFDEKVIKRTAQAVRQAVETSRPVTHIGVGEAKVDKVASNRRILGPDGKVKIVRYSSSRNPEAIAAPEGVIDPFLRLLSFWNEETPIASLTYYATHPQSYYGDGDVTAEFPGMARAMREQELPGVAHIHFNGAGGNVAAGKYNDGSPERRPILAQRMAEAMRTAWESTQKTPIEAKDFEWRVQPVRLPPASHMVPADLREIVEDSGREHRERLNAASHLAWALRCQEGRRIDVTDLRLGDVHVLHMPGELFVEYQLAAQEMKQGKTVLMAAYGDFGPGYIGTEVAYSQGGYETSAGASRVAPEVESVLMEAMKTLLE
ncbi:MAG: hypothetical protein O2968_04550 [Acidobacteria bacterium]|nr:hypothetical protein [Acidobacteriota bacterium]